MRHLSALPALILAGAAMAQPEFTVDQVRADFNQLYETLQAAHADLYVETDRADYDALFRAMLADLDQPLSREEVLNRFQRFVAAGRVAHARMEGVGESYSAHLEAGGKSLPLTVRMVDDRMYVQSFAAGSALRPGDEILAINGESASALAASFRDQLSADSDRLAWTMLEFTFPRLLWQRWPERDQHRFSIKRAGETLTVKLDTLTREAWRAIDDEQQIPVLELSWTEREARILPDGTAYLRPGPFYNVEGEDLWDNSTFLAFIDDAFQRFIAADAPRLLIDLRDNPGGDNSFSDPMVAWFADEPFRFFSRFEVKVSEAARAANEARLDDRKPGSVSHQYARLYADTAPGEMVDFEMPMAQPREGERYQGEVYALVNRHSYSNTVTTAAQLQDYGFATILGEETADLASSLGAMEHFTLDNTGLVVGFPKARITRPNGNPERRGVVPDIALETPVVEGPEDPVLQRALAIIRY